MDDLQGAESSTEWLNEVLEETCLQKFHSKLTNDLQLTKLSHFDYVSEDDLISIGLSRPAAKRLLAAIKKRKSSALKSRIVGKLIWGGPKLVDGMYLKNQSQPGDTKGKTKSRLSKLFGISESNTSNQLLHAYHKFSDEPLATPKNKNKPIVRSQSDDFNSHDAPPLIDFDSDIPNPINVTSSLNSSQRLKQQESLIDSCCVPMQRRNSDTKIDNYHISWAGSWNTGTFYGSNSNIYSNYYCPQDAAGDHESTNHYYSAVEHDEPPGKNL